MKDTGCGWNIFQIASLSVVTKDECRIPRNELMIFTFASTRLQFHWSIQAIVTIFLGWTSGTMSGVSIRKKVNGLLDRIWFLSEAWIWFLSEAWMLSITSETSICLGLCGYSWLALLGCNAPTGSVIKQPSLFFKPFWNKELSSLIKPLISTPISPRSLSPLSSFIHGSIEIHVFAWIFGHKTMIWKIMWISFYGYQSSKSTSFSSFSSPSFTRSNFITPMQSGTLSIVMYLFRKGSSYAFTQNLGWFENKESQPTNQTWPNPDDTFAPTELCT